MEMINYSKCMNTSVSIILNSFVPSLPTITTIHVSALCPAADSQSCSRLFVPAVKDASQSPSSQDHQ